MSSSVYERSLPQGPSLPVCTWFAGVRTLPSVVGMLGQVLLWVIGGKRMPFDARKIKWSIDRTVTVTSM